MQLKTTLTLIITGIFSLTACATTTATPLRPGALAVRIGPDTDVEIVQTTAHQDGENVIIAGHLQRKKVRGRTIPKGYVDIAIIDGHGKTIHKTSTAISPEIVPRISGAKSSFIAQIPVKAPLESSVSVKFHYGSY